MLSLAPAKASDIDWKKYELCENQYKFIFYSAIASTGRNILMSDEDKKVPMYRYLGRKMLLTDAEIDSVVSSFAKDQRSRVEVVNTYDDMAIRDESISCSQLPDQYLMTYKRLKEAKKID